MFDPNAFREEARRRGGIGRRMFLAYSSALASLPSLLGRAEGATARRASFASDPFRLGVASGDPTSTGVVLWTRLAPKPLEPGGGLAGAGAGPIEVRWEIAGDEGMKGIVREGVAVATPQLGHSIHVEAEGLKPDRWYWYRFRAGDAESRVGRARTLPEASSRPDSLRFAFASCQHFEQGLFTAYEHMARDEEASLIGSEGTWNVLAQQVMMGLVDQAPGEARAYPMDQWPGAAHERMELVRFLDDRKVPNPVVLTGDIHSNWVNDLRVDDRKAELPVVATEFVGTSISSGGNGPAEVKGLDALLAENPCLKFVNRQRGYVRCHVTPGAWRSDYIVVEDVTRPGAPAVHRASFEVEAGKPGARKV